VLPTHKHVKTHLGCQISQRLPGFEFTPMMLGKIASFIATTAGGEITVFAFMYSLLQQLEGEAIDEDVLLADAVSTIEDKIAAGGIGHHQERTFEYRADTYVEVTNPPWWIPSWA